jgi:hypothetical protein
MKTFPETLQEEEEEEEEEVKEELFRIVSAFQATKSFIGKWINPDDELQKRGTFPDKRRVAFFLL